MPIKRSLNLSANETKSWNAFLRLASEPIALRNGLTLTLIADPETHGAGVEHWATVLGRYRLRFQLKRLPAQPTSQAMLEPKRAAEMPSGIRTLLQERTISTVLATIGRDTGADIGAILGFTYGGETASASGATDDTNWLLEIRRGDEIILAADISITMRACIYVARALGFVAPADEEMLDGEIIHVGLRLASVALPVSDIEGLEAGDLVVLGTLQPNNRQLSISGRLYNILADKDGQLRLELTP
jgi:hypothetical protein